MPLPVKVALDSDGHAIMEEGQVVYEFDDGTQSPLDVIGSFTRHEEKLSNLTSEKDRQYKALQKTKAELKKFDGYTLDNIKSNAELVANLKDKEILDSNGVKALKQEMKSGFEAEKQELIGTHTETLAAAVAEQDKLKKLIRKLTLKNMFANDEHFAGSKPKTIYGPEDAFLIFGPNFDTEIKEIADNGDLDVVITAYDGDRKKITSKQDHGEPAKFGEAVSVLVASRGKSHPIYRSGLSGGPRNVDGNVGDPDSDVMSGKSSTAKIAAGLKRKYGR